jgi:transcriptional regulator GlxA family with amidase domain
MLKNAVWQWQSGVALPQLGILLRICQGLRLSLLDFLFNPETLNTTCTIVATPHTYHPSTQSLKRELETHQLQQSLEAALAEEPPSPMETVAQRLGFSSRSLRRRFPTLCSAISTRYLSYREKIHTAKVEQSCQEIRQVALKLYDEGIDPTRSYIARFLSKPAYFREPLVAATLERVRQELGLEKPYIPKQSEPISEA